MSAWRPTASQAARRARADLLARVRAHFAAAGVLEVETPALSRAGTTDPNIDSASVVGAVSGHLHTSPEFAMKRLLAAGSGDCFQVARVFRVGEQGARHNPEFSLLEWYRLGYSLADITSDTLAVLESAWGRTVDATQLSLREACTTLGGYDPFDPDVPSLRGLLEAAGHGAPIGLAEDEVDAWLDCAFSTLVAPRFEPDRLTCVAGYPASQASLARVEQTASGPVALRVEVFYGDLELGNGFEELLDADEQRTRFERERAQRFDNGRDSPAVDTHLIDAMQHGLPACAGMAIGVDRVLMAALGAGHIDEVLNFPWGRA
ncbi:MAG: EF-P lysine aminoacylase EpmA [Pseudomonadota bacterium]